MTAGERVFVDLLPDSWTGAPPGLPAEVVRELSDRARAAERALRLQKANADARKKPPVRVRALMQPTFVRFVFEMPDNVGVSSVLNEQKLTLLFNTALTFDLADAKVAAPPNVASINQRIDGDTSLVEAELIGDVDVHSFREEKNYIVDVAFQQMEKAPVAQPPATQPHAAAEPHAPGRMQPRRQASAPPAAPLASAARQAAEAPRPAAEIVAPTSETVAEQAKIEIKPEATSEAGSKPGAEPHATEKPAAVEPAKAVTLAEQAAAVESKPVEVKPAEDKKAKFKKPQAIPAAETPGKTMPAAGETSAAADDKSAVVAKRDSDALRVTFTFDGPTPAALFRRADTVWLVFDSTKPLDVEPIRSKGGALLAEVSRLDLAKGQAIRIRLNRPQLPSLKGEDAAGKSWTLTFADTMQAPPLPLVAIRNVTDPALANVSVPLANPGHLHRFSDPDAGDTLLVVTAPPPIRGLIKRQDFVELSLLESIHGIAVQPTSEEVTAEIGTDKIRLGRPGGLTLSSADVSAERAATAVKPMFDVAEWRKNQAAPFVARQDALMLTAAATTAAELKLKARMDLARFYMSRGMYYEGKAVAEMILLDTKPGGEDSSALNLRALANLLVGRPELALKDLANPVIATNYDSQLWRALAHAQQGKWADAREKFKNVEFAIASLPPELQRIVLMEAMRASLEVKDYAGAARRRGDLDVIGMTPEIRPAVSVLRGRLAEALGHDRDAQSDYKFAIESGDRAAAAEATLRDVVLRQKREEVQQAEALRELETLSVSWRGDCGRGQGADPDGRHVCRCRALQRCAAGGADRDTAAAEFGGVTPVPGHGGGAVCRPLSQSEGRRPAAGRGAGDVLRIPRTDPDRPPRRRDDPTARRPAGRHRPARPGGGTAAVPDRQAA